ncbi:MAG: sugar phosphate isomerase/epimerase [Acidobacteriota bacterium]|nr:sugar phosphate isomerase/epimerase [Acidobacteriota bacterium]
MVPGLSTHAFFDQRLHPGLLDALAAAGARVGLAGMTIEVFAARHHFNYTDAQALREIAAWFRSNDVRAVLHQPLYVSDRADAQWSRHVAPNLNLISTQKTQRIDAMDEVKRALEAAERIPFAAAVLHLGLRDTAWDDAAIEYSITAIEHLKAFASPLGMRLLLENLQNEVATPEHLLYIMKTGHFDNVGVCLDIGHLHLTAESPGAAPKSREPRPPSNPYAEAFALLGSRIGQLHLHDNHGPFGNFASPTDMHDEHLWPGEGTVDWSAVHAAAAGLPVDTPGVFEPAPNRERPAAVVTDQAERAFRALLEVDPVASR